MLKRFLLISILTVGTFFAVPTSALAEIKEYINIEGDLGEPGYVDVYLQTSDASKDKINIIWFYNVTTGLKYSVEFNPYNYTGQDIWNFNVNLPNGIYEITGGVYGDTALRYSMHTNTPNIIVQDDTQRLFCIIGQETWVEENKGDALWESAGIEVMPTIVQPTPMQQIKETTLATPAPSVPYIPSVKEEPTTEQNTVSLVRGGIIVAIFGGFLLWKQITKRRKRRGF